MTKLPGERESIRRLVTPPSSLIWIHHQTICVLCCVCARHVSRWNTRNDSATPKGKKKCWHPFILSLFSSCCNKPATLFFFSSLAESWWSYKSSTIHMINPTLIAEIHHEKPPLPRIVFLKGYLWIHFSLPNVLIFILLYFFWYIIAQDCNEDTILHLLNSIEKER